MINPNSFEVTSNLAILKKQEGKFEEALEDFNRIINVNPNEAILYNNRADTYMKLNDYVNAMNDIEKAIELDADYAIAYATKGEIYVKLNKPMEACFYFKTSINKGLNPKLLASLIKNCE